MNRKLAILILVIIEIFSFTVFYRLLAAKAVIWIQGHITSNTTWMPVDTYRVIGDTYVDPGVTLTILPGVHVQFADGFSLFVDGNLNANGTESDPIIFTSSRVSPSPGLWNTIKFKGSSSECFLLRKAKIEYAVHGVIIESMGTAIIERSEFTSCSESGVRIIGQSNLVITNSTFALMKYGIFGEEISGIIAENNTFGTDCGIYAQTSTTIRNITLQNNQITSTGNGIQIRGNGGDVYVYDVSISNNHVTSNADAIQLQMSSYHRTYVYNVTFQNNQITSNRNGIYIRSDGRRMTYIYNISIRDNQIISNRNGIHMEARPPGDDWAYIYNVIIEYNQITSDERGIYMYADVTYFEGQRADIYNVTIQNNQLKSKSEGMCICAAAFFYADVYNIIIMNNDVVSNGNGIYVNARGWAAAYVNVYDLSVLNNQIMSNGNGIYINAYANVHDLLFANNQIKSCKEDGLRAEGSSLAAYDFHIVIANNTFSSNSRRGIAIMGLRSNITSNSISYNNWDGVYYFRTSGNCAEFNDIYGNSNYGIYVDDAAVKAEHNYWGHSTGPYHQSLNPEGQGNAVNGNGVDLDFIPFLTSPQGHINQRPCAVLSVDKIAVNINETVTFDASNSTDDGRIDYYFFDFGDGKNSSWTSLPIVTYEYSQQGKYNATLIVMDDYGVTSLDGNLVYVEITVVPEFPSALILPLFMIVTLFIVMIYKRKFPLNTKPSTQNP